MTEGHDTPVRRAQRAFDALIHAAHAHYAHRRACQASDRCAECGRVREEHRRAKRLYDTAIVRMLGGPEESPADGATRESALPEETTC